MDDSGIYIYIYIGTGSGVSDTRMKYSESMRKPGGYLLKHLLLEN